jgi:hypothetical protein
MADKSKELRGNAKANANAKPKKVVEKVNKTDSLKLIDNMKQYLKIKSNPSSENDVHEEKENTKDIANWIQTSIS